MVCLTERLTFELPLNSSYPWIKRLSTFQVESSVHGRKLNQAFYLSNLYCSKYKLIINQLDRFSRNAQATNWIEVTKKKLLVKTNFFSTFFLDRNLKMKNLNCYVICTIERRFFSRCEKWNKWRQWWLARNHKNQFALFSCCWPIS